MQRTLVRILLLGALITVAAGRTVSAAGPLLAAPDAAAPPIPHWPVLRDRAGSVLGLHGGRVSASTVDGQVESAALLILPTGYTAPVLNDGALATFPVAYFDRPGCKGREYLPPSADYAGLLPFPGLIYRSAASGQIMHIAQQTTPGRVAAKSRLELDAQGIRCEATEAVLPLLAAEPNAPAVTGMNRDGNLQGPISVAVEAGTGGAAKSLRRMRSGAVGSTLDAGTPEAAEEPQRECSPGCLEDAVGNGICDIPCYFESCRYDGGDCATMDEDELDKALANMCSPGCNREDIGDGFCDVACQTEACGQDGGDCDLKTTE